MVAKTEKMFERFKLIRRILGITQDELAEKLKVKRPFISMVEGARRWVDQRTLFRIKETTGVSPVWLESGGLVPMFVDIEKGVRTLRKKGYIENKHEAYFIFTTVQQLYAMVDEVSKKELLYSLLDCLVHLNITPSSFETIRTCWPSSVVGKNIEETVEKIKAFYSDEKPVPSTIMDYTLRAYCGLSLNLNEDEDFKKEAYDKVNKLLTPWLFYVALAYITVQHELHPLSSVYVFDEGVLKIEPSEEKIENFHSVRFEYKDAAIYEYHKKFIVTAPPFRFILPPEELFAFCVTVLNATSIEEPSFKVLDFDIYHDPSFASMTKSNLTVTLTPELFACILNTCSKVKEDKKLWDLLRYCFIEKYGFV